jgi:hypothetical protein
MEFTPNQKYSLLSKMGYTGPVDNSQMENFIASNPGAAAKMGKFQKAMARGFQTGGVVDPRNRPYSGLGGTGQVVAPNVVSSSAEEDIQETQEEDIPTPDFTGPRTKQLQEQAGITPELIEQKKAKVDTAESKLKEAQAQLDQWQGFQTHPGYAGIKKQFDDAQAAYDEASSEFAKLTDPQELLSPYQADLAAAAVTDPTALIEKPEVVKGEAEQIAEDTGQLGEADEAGVTTVEAETTAAPEEITAETMEAEKVTPEITEALEDLETVKGMVSKEGTVRGQLETLMEDFEGGQTPPWASGAMRQAMGIMQQRGLGASSIAGQAVVQAAMESALPIAQADAATVAQFEMANLNREQETVIFKTQQKIAGLISDQAAENAARQFNTASENQTKQFMSNLEQNAAQFNVAQVNAISQFNAGETNAVERFNTELKNQREQFNASNALVIAQANANWRQQVSLAETAAVNEANRVYTQQVNGITAAGLDNYWQEQRDKMSFAFQESENEKTRAANLMIAQLQASSQAQMQMMEMKGREKAAIGSLAATALFGGDGSGGLLGGALSSIF